MVFSCSAQQGFGIITIITILPNPPFRSSSPEPRLVVDVQLVNVARKATEAENILGIHLHSTRFQPLQSVDGNWQL